MQQPVNGDPTEFIHSRNFAWSTCGYTAQPEPEHRGYENTKTTRTQSPATAAAVDQSTSFGARTDRYQPSSDSSS